MNSIGLFLFFSFATMFVMKLVAYICAKAEKSGIDQRYFYSTPILCPKSYLKKDAILPSRWDRKMRARNQIAFELIFSTLALIFIHTYYQLLIEQFEFIWRYKEFFLIFYIYIFTVFMSNSFRALSLFFNSNPPAMHNKPYLSKNLNEFWTLRWNLWVRNWLHYLGKKLYPKNITMRQLSIFIISGLFHETMFNVPYYILTGKVILGSMIGYFVVQFIATKIDHLLLKKYTNKITRYIFMWFALIAPAPLFINDAFLLFFGFN